MRRVLELAGFTGFFVASLAVLGCGGDGGSGSGSGFNVGGPSSCGQVLPCGGDLTGTWAFDTACITAAGIADATSGATCPGESLAVTDVKVSGTATFNPDLTYAFDALSKQATYRLSVPQSCLGGATCDQVPASLLATGEFQSANCSGTSTCTCTVVQIPVIASESGTYTISGNTVLTTSDVGNPGSIDYCVQTNHFHITITQAMSMGMAGQATIIEDTVATKQ